MKNKRVFVVALAVMVAALLCMMIGRYVEPHRDLFLRISGIVILVDLFVLAFSFVRMKMNGNNC